MRAVVIVIMARAMVMKIEFFFDCSSPWTYLAFEHIQPLAVEFGAEIVWRPILVGGIFNAVNPGVEFQKRLATEPPRKMAYYLKDLEDWARASDLKIMFTARPSCEQRESHAGRSGTSGAREAGSMGRGYLPGLFWRGSRYFFGTALARLCDSVDIDPAASNRAKEQPVKDASRANVNEAISRGAFGSPTMFLDADDMYFGVDRLPMLRKAMERKKPASAGRSH